MPVAERLLVDTNILLEATDAKRPYHQEARELIESYRGLVLPAQVIREYLVVTTRPTAANGLGMSLADALANAREFRRAIRLLPENKPLLPTLLRLLATVPCSGTRIHDAHIVASRLPLPELNGKGSTAGVYELNLAREWFEKAAPFLKVLTGTLSLVLPVAASATKFVMDDTAYKGLEKELDLGQKSLDSVLKGGEKSGAWLGRSDAPDLERGEAIRAQGAVLRQLHALLKEKDPSFGGLVRVQNKRQEFLWVHPQFEKEY